MTLIVRPPELVLEDILNRAYDKFADMLKVTSVQKKWRDSFAGTAVDASKWDVTTGAGASVSVSGGAITIASTVSEKAISVAESGIGGRYPLFMHEWRLAGWLVGW